MTNPAEKLDNSDSQARDITRDTIPDADRTEPEIEVNEINPTHFDSETLAMLDEREFDLEESLKQEISKVQRSVTAGYPALIASLLSGKTTMTPNIQRKGEELELETDSRRFDYKMKFLNALNEIHFNPIREIVKAARKIDAKTMEIIDAKQASASAYIKQLDAPAYSDLIPYDQVHLMEVMLVVSDFYTLEGIDQTETAIKRALLLIPAEVVEKK